MSGYNGIAIPSLDSALRRINSIENQLANIGLANTGTPLQAENVEKKEFQKILDEIQKPESENKTTSIDSLIEKYADKNELDPAFIKAVIKQESGFNPHATSQAGAMGLMQLMPGTANGLGVKDAYDPSQNIEGGAKYLKSMMNRFNDDPSLALAAYNAGPNAVSKHGGVPPYKETQAYVKNVLKAYQTYKGEGL